MMRSLVAAAFLLAWTPAPAAAQVTIQFGVPNVAIGIDLPVFPRMVRVPGSPVYYSPVVNGNYFFYDGMYWVFQGDAWYASAWFNGPWAVVPPQAVPAFVLRVPVRYYRVPPPFFRGWRPDGPPRWGEHWGADWARERAGWTGGAGTRCHARRRFPCTRRSTPAAAIRSRGCSRRCTTGTIRTGHTTPR